MARRRYPSERESWRTLTANWRGLEAQAEGGAREWPSLNERAWILSLRREGIRVERRS